MFHIFLNSKNLNYIPGEADRNNFDLPINFLEKIIKFESILGHKLAIMENLKKTSIRGVASTPNVRCNTRE